MPEAPAGEARLRELAQRFTRAEGQILKFLANATNGGRTAALTEALAILNALRLLDARTPVALAYLHEHPQGNPTRVRDLARSLAQRLDHAARTATKNARIAFGAVDADNLDEMAITAVLATVDRRGTRWSLGRWAEMNCQTLGRQATSRGITDREGEGGHLTINTGDCAWCQSHAGDAIIGTDPLPPYHPSCSCTATAA
jgi:hypothetical protein